MTDERFDPTLHVNANGAQAILNAVREAAGRLDRQSVAQPLVAAWTAVQRAEKELAALIDGLPVVGPDQTRADSFFVLSRLDAAVSGVLHVLATQAAERAVAAYKSTDGPVDTRKPD